MSEPTTSTTEPVCMSHAQKINAGLAGTDLHGGADDTKTNAPGSHVPFRISPEPFYIDAATLEEIETLGSHLLRFYEAMNRIYMMSVRGTAPSWVREWLELGKSEAVIEYQRVRRFRSAVPPIIRPDIIPTDDGLIISELDSVPGGMGLLAALTEQYDNLGYELVGGRDGIVQGLWDAMIDGVKGDDADPAVAVVVSDESESYRGEMQWLSRRWREMGKRAVTVHPRDIVFHSDPEGDAIYVHGHGENMREDVPIDVLYRFFELFDLKNIPQIDLIVYAARKNTVHLTPPLKSYLEEKMLFALLHHQELKPFWREHLGRESYDVCRRVFPRTWVMDPAEVPPHAAIPGLEAGGMPVRDFRDLGRASQRERELVIKPSGFSPNAWGSRGVMIGHDVSADDWSNRIDDALSNFSRTPHILQRFHQGARFPVSYFDFRAGEIKPQPSRARLCPYYFVVGGKTRLGGILATCTSLEKKIIHGMSEAIMMPTAVKKGDESR